MTANELFAWMESMNPSPYNEEQKTLWLNDLEANLWTEVLLQPAGLWKPRKGSEGDRPLLLPESRRMLYAMYLWAMMDFARGEHGSYANSMALYNDHLAQLQCWYAETYAPAMAPAVWTEWAVCACEDGEEPKCIMSLPGGCAVLGAECRVEEAGELRSIALGTEGEPEAYMPFGVADPAAEGICRFFRFQEPLDRAVYAHGEGTGKVRFRLLLQPQARKGSHSAGQIPGGAGGQTAAGAVVAGEKGEKGDPGPAGADGKDGKSAYEYAVEGGYTGTEGEFAALLLRGGVHIGPDAPADENTTLWVDTDETPEPESGSGGVSSWNELADRPFYSEVAVGTVLAETSPAFNEDASAFILTDSIRVITGEGYTVNWNGTEYTCVCVEVDSGDGIMAQALGNLAAIGGEDTGEPFFIIVTPDELTAETGFSAIIYPLDGSTELNISITGMTEVVHQIPAKYLSHRSIDVHFSVSANPDMSIVVTADMDASDVIRYAKTPNTTIRAVRINKGIDDVLVLGLVSANSEVAVFRCITGIENSSIVGQAPEGVALATTFSKCLFAELYAYSDGTYSYEQISA